MTMRLDRLGPRWWELATKYYYSSTYSSTRLVSINNAINTIGIPCLAARAIRRACDEMEGLEGGVDTGKRRVPAAETPSRRAGGQAAGRARVAVLDWTQGGGPTRH